MKPFDKTKVKVLVADKKQAKQFKHALGAMGEPIDETFFNYYENNMYLIHGKEDWFLVFNKHSVLSDKKEITIKELIQGLSEQQVQPFLLSGKCAIQVNNEREFKLLMEHYESKGWEHKTLTNPITLMHLLTYNISYEDGWRSYYKNDGYTIIPFADFAAELGITVPKFVCKSEDGVDLYEGDDIFTVHVEEKRFGNSSGWKVRKKSVDDHQGRYKYFVSLTAAEKWIAEANKPKEIRLTDNNCNTYAIVNGNGFIAHVNRYNNAQLEQIYTAYKSLKEEE